MTLSPDGRTLAYGLDGGANGAAVVAMDPASGEPRRTYRLGATAILRDVTWVDDETLLIEVSTPFQSTVRGRPQQHFEVFRRIALDLHGSEPRVLPSPGTDTDSIAATTIVAARTPDPKTVLLTMADAVPHQWDTWRVLYAVDLLTGAGRVIDPGPSRATGWITNGVGVPLARGEWVPSPDEFRVSTLRGKRWSTVYRRRTDRPLTLVAAGPADRSVLAVGAIDADRAELWSIALDGSGARKVAGDAHYDVQGVLTDRFDGHVTGLRIGGLVETTTWLDAAAQARHEGVARAFPDRRVEVYDRSRDGGRVLARVSAPSAPPVYYVVDVAKHTADVVGEAYPGLAGATLGAMQPITYPARDGTPIPAYLTLPPGLNARDLPLIVLPHDGPEARDHFAFDWLVQFLATRGYAVLQPQFRGSTGFGVAWRRAAQGVWGGQMQDDLGDGVAAMVRQRIADPNRVCIVGQGYGGYAALAGAAFTPALYRCAVSIAGLADLTARLPHAAPIDTVYDALDPDYRLDVTGESPTRRVASVIAPILLVHGTYDAIVPVRQSELMAAALTRAGKPHEFVRLEGADHGLSRSEARTRALTEIERFLAQHLR